MIVFTPSSMGEVDDTAKNACLDPGRRHPAIRPRAQGARGRFSLRFLGSGSQFLLQFFDGR